MVQVDERANVPRVEYEERTTEIDHPREREVGDRLVGVAPTDVGVHAGEPALVKVDL